MTTASLTCFESDQPISEKMAKLRKRDNKFLDPFFSIEDFLTVSTQSHGVRVKRQQSWGLFKSTISECKKVQHQATASGWSSLLPRDFFRL